MSRRSPAAAELFARGGKNAVIARRLRVSQRSVERWRRSWREGGTRALHSTGPPSLPKLSDAQFARLERELEQGPLAWGFADQRWTLLRIKALIGRRFHVGYTVQGVWRLLRRHGWSCQRPARRAIERDDAAIEVGKKEVWPAVENRGGPGRLGLFRGRIGSGAETATGTDLGPARTDTGGAGTQWRYWPGVHRRLVQGESGRAILRENPAPTAESRRQSAGQRRPLPHRHHTTAPRSTHPRLPGTTYQGRQVQARDHPLSEALRRMRNLPPYPAVSTA